MGPAWVETETGAELVAGGRVVATVRMVVGHTSSESSANWSSPLGRKTSGSCYGATMATACRRVEAELLAAGRGDLVPAP
jgi:hypothetical protein